MCDLVLKGGRIYDGSGLPSFNGDLALAGGKIVEIGLEVFLLRELTGRNIF